MPNLGASVVVKRAFNSSNQLNERMSGWALEWGLAVGYAEVRSAVVFESRESSDRVGGDRRSWRSEGDPPGEQTSESATHLVSKPRASTTVPCISS